MANSTSFKAGNQWRFSKDCQPQRKMTTKQTLKAIDAIIAMSCDELDKLINNTEASAFLRETARKVYDGDVLYVVELREKYKQSI